MIRPNVSILSLSMNFSGDDKFKLLEMYDITGIDYLVNMADAENIISTCILFSKNEPPFKLLTFGDGWKLTPGISLDKLKRMFLEEVYTMMYTFSHRRNSVRFRLVHTHIVLENGERFYIYAESFDCREFILNVSLCNDETEEETTVAAGAFTLEDRTYSGLVKKASEEADKMLDKIFDFEKYLRTGDFTK